MLRHCPITRFSSSGARRKMPTAACGKETSQVPPEDPPPDPAEAKDVAKGPLPPQKVLKIFSINIIAQGLPFCRRRVSTACCGTTAPPPPSISPQKWANVKGHRAKAGRFIYFHGKYPLQCLNLRFFPSLFAFGLGLITAETVTVPLCCLPCIGLFLISILTPRSTGWRHRRCNTTLIPFRGPYFVDGVFKYASGWCVSDTRSPTFLKTNTNLSDINWFKFKHQN